MKKLETEKVSIKMRLERFGLGVLSGVIFWLIFLFLGGGLITGAEGIISTLIFCLFLGILIGLGGFFASNK